MYSTDAHIEFARKQKKNNFQPEISNEKEEQKCQIPQFIGKDEFIIFKPISQNLEFLRVLFVFLSFFNDFQFGSNWRSLGKKETQKALEEIDANQNEIGIIAADKLGIETQSVSSQVLTLAMRKSLWLGLEPARPMPSLLVAA